MSPLWSDEALAEAGWANAVERGLVDDDSSGSRRKVATMFDRVRRIPRRQVHSFAL